MFHPMMTYKSLGKCGLKVSALGLGGWTTFGGSVRDRNLVRQILTTAYQAGVNFFDIADIYAQGESEVVMGEVLKDFPRHELIISSKVFWPMSQDINDKGLSRKHIMESVEKSLKRIGTDYLDLYFCHRFDPETPLEETLRAMDDLIHQGKVLYWGTSEWTADQLKEAWEMCDHHGWYRPQVEQPQYSLVVREKFEEEVAPMARDLGMGLVTWSPLASGLLTGKYDQGMTDGRLSRVDWLREIFFTEKNLEKVRKLKAISDALGCSRTQLALAWASSHRAVNSVILGATSRDQLNENLGSLKISITQELKQELDRLFPLHEG